MRLLFSLFGSIALFSISAQDFSLMDIDIRQGTVKDIAFAGGLRAPQFSQTDLNLDGDEDLVIFDREGAIIIPLLYDDGRYRFAPEYRAIFPKVRSWMLLADFNGDGVKDLFCSPTTINLPGVELWVGKIIDEKLSFDLRKFPDRNFDVLHFPIGSSFTQIFVSPVDLPAIKDIDNDGDLDIIAFEPSGQSAYWYKNQSADFSRPLDSLVFRIGDQCFGKFIESGFSQTVNLSPSDTDCANAFRSPDQIPLVNRHSGSTVTAIDIDINGLQDILLGDVSYDGIVALYNTGSLENAWMTSQDDRFPVDNEQVDIELFNGTFQIQQKFAESLIVAPNDRNSSQTTNHIWKFDRSDLFNGPKFQISSKNFLVEDMVYFGENSSPLFWDYNQDGLVDLLVGSSGISADGIQRNPKLSLFKNTGSLSQPSFELVDDDYLGLSVFRDLAKNFSPSIGDIDGDGDMDMIVGDDTGRLIMIENTSNSMSTFQWKTSVYEYMGIRVSGWAKPEIYDYNKDGLGDLIVGEQNFNSSDTEIGSLNYYQNIGEKGSAMFNAIVEDAPNTPYFGKFFMSQAGFVSNYSAPRIVQLTDRDFLAVGSQSGNIFLWDSIAADSFISISKNWGDLREGFISAVSIADIDNDGYGEIAIGTRRGGLAIYNTPLKVDTGTSTAELIESEPLSIQPNPSIDDFQIELPAQCRQCDLIVIAPDGRKIIHEKFGAEKRRIISAKSWSAGIYIMTVSNGKTVYQGKVIHVN